MDGIRELSMEEIAEVSGGRHEQGLEYEPKRIPAGCVAYKIQRGDTLRKLADARGITTADIMKLNQNIKNPSYIVQGFWLILPA